MKKQLILSLISLALTVPSAFAKSEGSFQIAENHKHHNHKGVDHSKHLKVHYEAKVADLNIKFYMFDFKNVNSKINKLSGDGYSCSMHPFIIMEDGGSCPICNMNMDKKSKKDLLLDTSKNNNHLEVVVYNGDKVVTDAKVKIKVIAPNKKDTQIMLDNMMGSYGADLQLSQKGKHGIIALVKIGNKERVAKFYYNN